MKKAFCVITAVLLLVSISFGALAADNEAKIVVSSATVGADGYITVTVSGERLTRIRGLRMELDYNSELFKDVEATDGLLLKALSLSSEGSCLTECRAESGSAVLLFAAQNPIDAEGELFTLHFIPKSRAVGAAELKIALEGKNAFQLLDENKNEISAEIVGQAFTVGEKDFGVGLESYISGAEAVVDDSILPIIAVAFLGIIIAAAVAFAIKKYFVNKK